MLSRVRDFFMNKKYFEYYIYFYIFFLPIETFDVQMRVLSVVLLIWWLMLGKKEDYFIKLKEILFFKPLVLFFITLSYFYLSILWSSSIEDGLKITARIYKYYWLVVPILFTSVGLRQAKNAFLILTLSFISYAIFSFLIYNGMLTGFGKGTTVDNPTGIYKYTVTSYYMIFGMLFSFMYFLYNSKFKYKVFFILGICFSSFAFVVINGRNAKVTFLLVVIFLCIINWKLFRKIKYLFILLSFITLLLFSISQTDTYNKFKLGINEAQTFDMKENNRGSWRERLFMLNVGIEVFKENPIFGAGGNDNIKYLHDYIDNNNIEFKKYWNLHNLHIEYLSRYGIVGYLLFMTSIVILLYFLRNEGIYFQLALTYFGVVILSGFGDPLIYLEPHSDLYGLVFVLFAIIAYKSKENQKGNIENHS